jgi:hypothetical protein
MATPPTPPKTEHLEALVETVEAARQDLIDTCERLSSGGDWEEIPATFRAWETAAHAWNEAVAAAAADVRGFIEEHSERWQATPRGTAYEDWADALEEAQIEVEPLDTLTLYVDISTGDLTVDTAEDVLPETPELPTLDL